MLLQSDATNAYLRHKLLSKLWLSDYPGVFCDTRFSYSPTSMHQTCSGKREVCGDSWNGKVDSGYFAYCAGQLINISARWKELGYIWCMGMYWCHHCNLQLCSRYIFRLASLSLSKWENGKKITSYFLNGYHYSYGGVQFDWSFFFLTNLFSQSCVRFYTLPWAYYYNCCICWVRKKTNLEFIENVKLADQE